MKIIAKIFGYIKYLPYLCIVINQLKNIAMKTVKEIRYSFWENNPEFKTEYRVKKRQNNYSKDIALSFIDYVEYLRASCVISEKLAYRATL